jgi:Winged helix DNA-binding domain
VSSTHMDLNIPHQRLHNQLITQSTFTTPDEVVRWLGAVQAQDYAGAKWAIGLRLQNATNTTIEEAFNEGAILRTHILRPTWHFVSPLDIRWILELTGPRVNAYNAHYYRKMELDDAIFARSNAALENALKGGKQLTRSELLPALEQADIATNDLRSSLLIMRAELDMLICSGARRGKQFTYALLAERAPQALLMERNDALAELSRRYIASRGPVTVQDFVWWSGLTTTDARVGFEMVASEFSYAVLDGKTYWFSSSSLTTKNVAPTTHLLPPFDEYTIAYKDRSAVIDSTDMIQTRNGIFSPIIVLDGRIVGTWKRTLKKDTVILEMALFNPLNETETQALNASIKRYGTFVDMAILTL